MPQPSATSFRQSQFRWTTDPTFYPSARLAMEAPRERYAYVAGIAPDNKSRSDALLVVDVNSASQSYGQIVGGLELPNIGDELHHFGWNACSAALCPYAPHPQLERRYLVVPWTALLSDPYHRHQTGSTKAGDRKNN
jgi:selenium-binding protein 1